MVALVNDQVFTSNPSNNRGIVKLYTDTNLTAYDWRADGNSKSSRHCYFFIPPRFVYVKYNNFHYITPFQYINRQEIVNGVSYTHHGAVDLSNGRTVDFWHFKPRENIIVEPITDPETRLPYLLTQNIGEPNFTQERCYFIPVPEWA